MSSRGASTVPNSPDYSLIGSHNGDFARLIPENPAAKLAFHEVVDKLKSDSSPWREWREHVLKHMHISDEKCISSFTNNITDSEATDSEDRPSLELYTGYYRLNLEIAPASKAGWAVGRGRRDLPGQPGVDFLLTCSKNHSVSGRHASFTHHRTTDALLIVVPREKSVVLNGTIGVHHAEYALTESTTGMAFGDLTYVLEFTDMHPKLYSQQLQKLRISNGIEDYPSKFLSATPTPSDYSIGGYIVKAAFASGSTSIVSSGIQKSTGEAVAIKKIKRDARNFGKIEEELEIMKLVCPHPHIINLLHILYVGDGTPSSLGSNGLDELYFIFSPLAHSRLSDYIRTGSSLQSTFRIIGQCLSGLNHIHEIGIMHRDIKPGNIILTSHNGQLNARLIDFGVATRGETSTNHNAGTIPYLAPEIIALKHGQSSMPYNKSVDIWAIGIVAYEAVFGKDVPWNHVTLEGHAKLLNELGGLPSRLDEEFRRACTLVERMVMWRWGERPTAKEALEDEALKEMDMISDQNVGKTKRTREEEYV